MKVSVRQARAQDGEAIAQLWTDAYCGPEPCERDAPYILADFTEAAAAGRVLVALEGDAVVGVVVLYPPGSGKDVAREGEAELSRLAVATLARGRGIGRTLAERCVAAARVADADAVVLWSRAHQNIAHRLYESIGFRRDPRRDRDDARGPRLVFTLPLSASARLRA